MSTFSCYQIFHYSVHMNRSLAIQGFNWPRWIHSTFTESIPSRCMLILSSYVSLGLSMASSLQILPVSTFHTHFTPSSVFGRDDCGFVFFPQMSIKHSSTRFEPSSIASSIQWSLFPYGCSPFGVLERVQFHSFNAINPITSVIVNCIIYRHDRVLKMVYNTQNNWVCELSTDPAIWVYYLHLLLSWFRPSQTLNLYI
jgi:hypothetical protein